MTEVEGVKMWGKRKQKVHEIVREPILSIKSVNVKLCH